MSTQTEQAKSQGKSLVPSDRRPLVTPDCDVYENQEEILLVADVPGVSADRINVHLDGSELMITALRVDSEKPSNYADGESRGFDFHRHFALPKGIDASKISAEVAEGILRLHLPKSEVAKPREIPVHAG